MEIEPTCFCPEALKNEFKNVNTAIMGINSDKIMNGSDRLVLSPGRYMSLYKCRTCGTYWLEACYSSGHMDLFYLYPVPPMENPEKWVEEEAKELPR